MHKALFMKKEEKMESDGEKKADILVIYKHGWKIVGSERFT